MSGPQPLEISNVTLDWIKVAAANAVTPEFAETVKAEVYRREVWGHLIHQLTAQILAERLPNARVASSETFHFEVPASPWQQFKQDHAGVWWLRWLIRRRPPVVRTHSHTGCLEVDLTRYWAYPEARVSRQLGRPVRVALIEQSTNWWTGGDS